MMLFEARSLTPEIGHTYTRFRTMTTTMTATCSMCMRIRTTRIHIAGGFCAVAS